MTDGTFLVLGGAGMVGFEVAHQVANALHPRRVVLASLPADAVAAAVERLRGLIPPEVTISGEWGDLFVREEFSHRPRRELFEDEASRRAIFEDLFGPFEAAFERSRLARLVAACRPDVVIDAVNTATAISYQDVYTAAVLAERDVVSLVEGRGRGPGAAGPRCGDAHPLAFDVATRTPHQILDRALAEVGTRLYVKIGTTGTGGMGLNIPYTHSEDRPSFTLMSKTAVAFAHTGLLFLMARTPDGPIVKEIKPAAMIGYADVTTRTVKEKGEKVRTFSSRTETFGGRLTLREEEKGYQELGTLDLPIVDTGENGLFARGEFETITSLRQMEFVTPEEIASETVLEIRGSNTGRDVIAEVDSGIMNSTYRAGYLRAQVLSDMSGLEEKAGRRSVALGQLGPPELSKLLWEAELLRGEYGTLDAVLTAEPEEISARLEARLDAEAELRQTITSIGLPILKSDGRRLIRGPRIRIPEAPGMNEVPLDAARIDQWAARGWVDLRPANFAGWQQRLQAMAATRRGAAQPGSAGASPETSISEHIEIGTVVAWVLSDELGGYRIK